MLVLGIESSCDETAAAILRNGTEVLSSIIFNQNDIHSKYGGVVPEIAGRCHVESIDLVIKEAIEEANITFQEIDLIIETQSIIIIGEIKCSKYPMSTRDYGTISNDTVLHAASQLDIKSAFLEKHFDHFETACW